MFLENKVKKKKKESMKKTCIIKTVKMKSVNQTLLFLEVQNSVEYASGQPRTF